MSGWIPIAQISGTLTFPTYEIKRLGQLLIKLESRNRGERASAADELYWEIKNNNQTSGRIKRQAIRYILSKLPRSKVKRMLKDSVWQVRRLAILLVYTVSRKKSLPVAAKMVEDKNLYVRQEAIMTIGKIGDKQSLDPLIDLAMAHSHSQTREHAIKAAQRVAKRNKENRTIITNNSVETSPIGAKITLETNPKAMTYLYILRKGEKIIKKGQALSSIITFSDLKADTNYQISIVGITPDSKKGIPTDISFKTTKISENDF